MMVLSAVGVLIVFRRHLLEVREMAEDEFLEKLRSSDAMFGEFHSSVFTPAGKFWKDNVVPLLYKFAGKAIFKFIGIVRKFENKLSFLDDYIHGKTHPKGNGGSKYWNDVNKFKNGLNGE